MTIIKKFSRLFLLVTLTIFSTTSLFAQPRATVAEPIKDLGIFYQDQLIIYDFIVRNEGNATLQITDVKPACGCTIADYDKTIEPGRTGKVHAKVNISTFNGTIAKGITVMTNDAANPLLELTIKAVVKQVIAVKPGYARFNILQGESENSKDVQVLASGDGSPFDVLSASSPLDAVSVSFREANASERLPGYTGKQWAIDVALNADNIKIGPLADYVIVSTNHPRQKEVKIAISGVVRPIVRVEPAVMNFGSVKKADVALIRTVLIRGNSLTRSFTVTKAETTVKGISADLKPAFNKNEYEILLTIDPSVVRGVFSGKLIAHTDNKIKPVIEVELKGEVL